MFIQPIGCAVDCSSKLCVSDVPEAPGELGVGNRDGGIDARRRVPGDFVDGGGDEPAAVRWMVEGYPTITLHVFFPGGCLWTEFCMEGVQRLLPAVVCLKYLFE